MVSFLFWNVKATDRSKLIRDAVRQHSIDVVAIAELGGNPDDLLTTLNEGVAQRFSTVESVAKRVRIFSRLPRSSFELISDDGEIFVRRISPPLGKDAILVAVHFPSKLHMNDSEQSFEAVRLRDAIDAAERRLGHSRTILIGDLNMNPFEAGLVGADALHAVMDKRIAKRSHRTVRGRESMYFYNPMWRFFGNGDEGPPGTYFLMDNSHISYFWNMFDQVLVRPELIDFLDESSVRILNAIGSTSLLKSDGRIDTKISDHLPIVATIQLERM